jgi:3'-phosphoadenosine 5'-phosphosulfate sulfotransferase (PAPS reductase)/FAD synthetase
MEIFHAIDSCDNAGLQARFQKAMGHIERTIELYGCGALAFSFNGGKDSTVSCANIAEATLVLLQEDNFDIPQVVFAESWKALSDACLGG